MTWCQEAEFRGRTVEQDEAEELTNRHFRYVVDMLDKCCRDGEFELLVVAIHGAELRDKERMVSDDVETSAAGGLAALGLSQCLLAGSVVAVPASATVVRWRASAGTVRGGSRRP